jgi:hypothetical protein
MKRKNLILKNIFTGQHCKKMFNLPIILNQQLIEESIVVRTKKKDLTNKKIVQNE